MEGEEIIPSLKSKGDTPLEAGATSFSSAPRAADHHHMSQTLIASNVTRRPSFSILRTHQPASGSTIMGAAGAGDTVAGAGTYSHIDSVAQIRRKVNKMHQNSQQDSAVSTKPPLMKRRTSFLDHNPSSTDPTIATLRTTRRLSQYSATSSQTSGSEKPSWFRRYMHHNGGQLNPHLNPNASLDPSMASTTASFKPCSECVCCLKGCKFFCAPGPERIRQMRVVKKSRVWKFGFNIFCTVLLFGAPFQALVVPKKYDVVMDLLYIVSFLFLICDIIFICYLVPSYANFFWKRKTSLSKGSQDGAASVPGEQGNLSRGSAVKSSNNSVATAPVKEEDATEPRIKLGSFSFWTELIGVCTLLLDLSFVDLSWCHHGWFFESDHGVAIHVNLSGGQSNPFFTYASNKARLLRYLVVVLKTTLIARFVQSSGVELLFHQWHNIRYHIQQWWKFGRKPCSRKRNLSDAAGVESDGIEGSQRNITVGAVLTTGSSAGMTQGLRSNHGSTTPRNGSKNSIKQNSTRGNAYKRSSMSLKLARVRKMYSQDKTDVQRRFSGPRGTMPRDAYDSLARIPDRQVSTRRHARKKGRSRVGSAMNEATVKRVAVGIIISLVAILLLSYQESDDSPIITATVLHKTLLVLDQEPNENGNTTNEVLLEQSARELIDIASNTTLHGLLEFQFKGESINISEAYGDLENLRELETWNITICHEMDLSEKRCDGPRTYCLLNIKKRKLISAAMYVAFTFFVMILWHSGVAFFAGPIATLVVNPIERMIKLLRMIMKNPLGYQDTKQFKQFTDEEEHLYTSTTWGKETLKGMETAFLMSTISRISSLLKVGYGTAGAEIIRKNLDRSATDDLILRGVLMNSLVSCIFLFCDIRRFTDSTECLKEEIFLFSNRVAAVVHSICHSFGGSANKNIGDAYLLSWTVDTTRGVEASFPRQESEIVAIHDQSDKALLSVVKINMALNYTSFFFEGISEKAKERLKKKFGEKEWNFVKLGFGLHAGKAVQGAIGSDRKVDATYISKAVDLSEYLESCTQKYHVSLLMSMEFHELLHKSNQRRCRKIDQVYFEDEEETDDRFDTTDVEGLETMELYTFDMDVDALLKESLSDSEEESMEESLSLASRRREATSINSDGGLSSPRRWSVGLFKSKKSISVSTSLLLKEEESHENKKKARKWKRDDKLRLPKDVERYDASMWQDADISIIRKKYSTEFFLKFNNGLSSYIAGDWDAAKLHFDFMVKDFDDGPSKYFLKEMEKHNFIRPWNFNGYSEA